MQITLSLGLRPVYVQVVQPAPAAFHKIESDEEQMCITFANGIM